MGLKRDRDGKSEGGPNCFGESVGVYPGERGAGDDIGVEAFEGLEVWGRECQV